MDFLKDYYFHVISLLLILLLALFNVTYRNELGSVKMQEQIAYEENQLLLDAINYNYLQNSLMGTIFPFGSQLETQNVNISNAENYLVMLTPFTVCSNNLRDELEILNSFNELLNDQRIQPVIVLGLRSSGEKQIIHRYIKQELLQFPFIVIDFNELHDFVPIIHDDEVSFVENPQYVILNEEYQVMSFFKSPANQSQFLTKWLNHLIVNT